ncbi:ATP-grasp domain-containing protein [Citricoccus sp. SGAir0253]|uniref:ATP-binding protein n=1 Tax=Citricoccus sp. SGAir0253 TaxID=2567881 RepID=UPI0010CD5DCC|nr:carboxyl transferase domain-containing protein [Citricoccus sp. SGAir0253]QCU78855.1 ATP-grasp domain-containing protein [Citricoccus sp. SGAir0253]
MFQRIAVVNRGEAAVRLIRAVREVNAEHGYGIRTLALHTEAERRAMFVRQADEGFTLRSTGTGTPYLDHAELERVLRLSRADAVWVGWGFVAEDPAFAELCERLGITLIGPSADAMRRLGDKVTAKLLAEEVDVPVAPWSGGPVESLADARRHAQNIGYPLIIKARSGGGGRGIRKVYAEDELEIAFERTQGEALRSFGDPVVFMERLVTHARHVEVQVIADAHGNVWAPGVRDCSIQRRNQKVIEESSSPLLSQEQSDHLRRVSADLVRAAGYLGAGTVEYLYQPEQELFTFLEVNTRLQVEHPITEATTGLDLVKLQLLVAAGEPLPGEMPAEFGHAVEARLNAEDADNEFAAAPGTVKLLNLPLGPGIRVDTGIGQGDVIPPEYDSMVAKIIAWGPDRAVALARLRTALRETTVVIDGGTTTKSFLLELLDREEVITASADTGWLDRSGAGTSRTPSPVADVALLATAVEVYEEEEALERSRFFASARGGRPRADHAVGRSVELAYQGQPYTFTVGKIGPHRYQVTGEHGEAQLDVERLGEFGRRVATGKGTYQVVSVAGTGGHLVEVDGVSHRITRDEAGLVRTPSPAVVMAVPVCVGDEVQAGDTLVVLESMKMETAVRAPQAGRVREVLASVNTQVDAGASLIRLESAEDQSTADEAPRVVFDLGGTAAQADPQSAALAQLDTLRALITGYDVTAAHARELLAEYEQAGARGAQEDAELVRAELEVLTTFADLCELARNRPALAEDELETRVHSPREFFHTYLHSLDPEREGLPASFQDRLSRALRHYDVTGLEHTPDLEQAVYRLFLAQQRIDHQIPVVMGLLERWLEGEPAAERAPEGLEEVLDRLVVATQARFPVVGDVARSLRFRVFEEPRIRAAREQVYDRVRGSIAYLAENPQAADRAQRIEDIVSGPEPILDMLSRKISRGGTGVRELLEAITRRYYKIRTLRQVESFLLGERPVVTGGFELQGDRLAVVSTVGDAAGLPALLAEVEPVAAGLEGQPVLDLYLSWADRPQDADAMAETLRSELASASWPADARRVTITVCGAEQDSHHQFTFRRDEDGRPGEQRVIRDMHPLTGQRVELWRFKNFDGTRLPAAPDTFVFHLAGKGNPEDERIVALAEIRDVTPEYDEDGAVVGLPMAERTVAACLDGIRRAQARRGARRRLNANRVVLYAWPVFERPVTDVAEVVARNIRPLTMGVGLEEITLIFRVSQGAGAEPREMALRYLFEADGGITTQLSEVDTEPLQPMDAYTQKVRKARSRGNVYPYEIIPLLTGEQGSFTEHDLDDAGRLVPVDRPYGQNTAGIVAGVVTTPTPLYPEGMTRVVLFGDPTKALGSLAEPECARVVAAIDLAEERGVPVEWFALSAGAEISMDRGTENMDWVSRALRRIVTFTQGGGEINIVVTGINVGAQPYWNAEATMLMHTKGILVMTPDSAMVLTGKHSLDYAGGVSAEDNFGIGGYDRVMGPNGQAQYWAPDLTSAVGVLFAHYDHAYVAPGERFPRQAPTSDPVDRDVRTFPHVHPSSDFTTVGDIFSAEANPDRKKPYDIRTVMRAVSDQDHRVLERWADMADADTSVVFDAHLGGHPVTLVGIESRAVPRTGQYPADGPDQWTAGTLFPRSSKKTARAINAASGNRPLVVLANLSGFDGSPESMRTWQLEFGAEIGRAIVNFDGPIVFCVLTRYHGGAFVVFSGTLNQNMEVAAVEGAYASVLGGSSAAAVVFTRDVDRRTAADPRVVELESAVAAAADEAERARLLVQLNEVRAEVRSEKLSEVGTEFDRKHSIERAREVGSVDVIVQPGGLRPYLVDAVERGLAGYSGRELESAGADRA